MRPSYALCLATCATLAALAPAAHAQRNARPPAQSAPALEAITADAVHAHLRFLSGDLLEGRAPGTRGGRLTEAYIASQFERLGLEPAGADGSFLQAVRLVGVTPQPSLVIGANRRTITLDYPDEFVAWPAVPEPSVVTDGEIVFVGYGIAAPEYGWDDYGGAPLTGKIALILVNDPGLRDSTLFSGRALTYYGRWTYKLEQAARMGAAGAILIHTDENATYPWAVVRNSWTGEQIALADRPPGTLRFAAWITWGAAHRVLQAAGRDLDAMVRRAHLRGFTPMPTGTHAAVHIRSDVRRFQAANVVGRLPGGDPTAAEEAVLFTAHHDHLGVGTPVNGDSTYNGAEDNASGVAVTLVMIEAFVRAPARPGRSLIFLATTAEEAGLLGAEAYLADPAVPLHRTAAVLNLDVANLRGATTDLTALGAEHTTLGPVVADAARAERLRLVPDAEPGRGSFFRSDHFPFARAGIPVLSFRSGTAFVDRPPEWGGEQLRLFTAERYHQPTDEFADTFDYAGAVQQARVMARTAWTIAAAREFYRWVPESPFRPAGSRLEALRRGQ